MNCALEGSGNQSLPRMDEFISEADFLAVFAINQCKTSNALKGW
jgi:hypothetical protein